jgi:hypothetical protein
MSTAWGLEGSECSSKQRKYNSVPSYTVPPSGTVTLRVAWAASRSTVSTSHVPAGHNEQDALPDAGLYLPSPHSKHVPPSAPENPELHRQADTVPLPAEDSEPAGQLIQEPAPEGL